MTNEWWKENKTDKDDFSYSEINLHISVDVINRSITNTQNTFTYLLACFHFLETFKWRRFGRKQTKTIKHLGYTPRSGLETRTARGSAPLRRLECWPLASNWTMAWWSAAACRPSAELPEIIPSRGATLDSARLSGPALKSKTVCVCVRWGAFRGGGQRSLRDE